MKGCDIPSYISSRSFVLVFSSLFRPGQVRALKRGDEWCDWMERGDLECKSIECLEIWLFVGQCEEDEAGKGG